MSDEANAKKRLLQQTTTIIIGASFLLIALLFLNVTFAIVIVAANQDNFYLCESFFLVYRIIEAALIVCITFPFRWEGKFKKIVNVIRRPRIDKVVDLPTTNEAASQTQTSQSVNVK